MIVAPVCGPIATVPVRKLSWLPAPVETRPVCPKLAAAVVDDVFTVLPVRKIVPWAVAASPVVPAAPRLIVTVSPSIRPVAPPTAIPVELAVDTVTVVPAGKVQDVPVTEIGVGQVCATAGEKEIPTAALAASVEVFSNRHT
jgi:hypothetical protein